MFQRLPPARGGTAQKKIIHLANWSQLIHPGPASGFFGVESVMRVNADSLLIRAAATSTSGTLIDLTTDLIMANNNNNMVAHMMVPTPGTICCIFTSNSIYFTLNRVVEKKSSLFPAVVSTAKVSKKSAGLVPLVTFFSRTLLHIQNYAGYLNNYDSNQLYLRCF